MYVRVTTIHSHGGPTATSAYSTAIAEALPKVTAQDGCLGGLVLADPLEATHHSVTFWDSAEAMVQSRGFGAMMTDFIVEEVSAFRSDTVVQVLDVVGVDLRRVVAATKALHEEVDFPLVDPN